MKGPFPSIRGLLSRTQFVSSMTGMIKEIFRAKVPTEHVSFLASVLPYRRRSCTLSEISIVVPSILYFGTPHRALGRQFPYLFHRSYFATPQVVFPSRVALSALLAAAVRARCCIICINNLKS